MMYKAKVAVCSEIHQKHWTQRERHVELLKVKRKETARLLKVNIQQL